MPITRLYTGSDGKSHLEELNVDADPKLTTLHGAKGVVFRATPPGHFHDWHNAPRRQYVITLEGEVEIGLEDGTLHRFGAGNVTLAEDLTGKGHTTRVVGAKRRVTATVHLE